MSLSGPKTTTTQNTNQTQSGSTSGSSNATTNAQSSTSANGVTTGANQSSTTPNLPGWYSSFLSSIPGQYASLAKAFTANANTPLLGAPQQAAFQNNLNQTQSQMAQALTSQLASRGALNSGNASQMQTQLALGGQKQLSDYLAQVPVTNAAYKQQNLQGLASLASAEGGFTSPISAFGTTTTGQQTGTTNQNSSSQSLTDLINNFLQSSNSTGTSDSTGTSQTSTNLFSSLLGNLLSAVGNSAALVKF